MLNWFKNKIPNFKQGPEDPENMPLHKLKAITQIKSIHSLALEQNINLSYNYHKIHLKYYFKSPNKNSFNIIKFLNNWGFFNKRFDKDKKCIYCEHKETSRTHVVNECPSFSSVRLASLLEYNSATNRNDITNLEEMLLDSFYKPSLDNNKESKMSRKLNKILSDYVYKLKKEAKTKYENYCKLHPQETAEYNEKLKEEKKEQREKEKREKKEASNLRKEVRIKKKQKDEEDQTTMENKR